MANFYLRVPHYVAAYYRNKDRDNPLPLCAPIAFGSSDDIYHLLCDSLYCNSGGTVNQRYCFSAKQWNRMLSGYSIDPSLSGKSRNTVLLSVREDELTLSDAEIFTLSGLPMPRGNNAGEYICIRMPAEVVRCGKLTKTNTWWTLTKNGAAAVRERMSAEFWRAIYAYMDRFRDYCLASGKPFVVIDGLERFMERYDIRNSPDNGERNTLKREYNRKRGAYKFTETDYVEFG